MESGVPLPSSILPLHEGWTGGGELFEIVMSFGMYSQRFVLILTIRPTGKNEIFWCHSDS